MEKLEKYFDYGVIKIFENDANIYKKINDIYVTQDDDKKQITNTQYNEDYTLCLKNMLIMLYYTRINLNNFGLYDFISLPENVITLNNLRLLEDRYIILEWYNENGCNYINSSNINCMKVYKYDDKMVYDKDLINPEDGIFVKRVSSNNDRYFIYPFERDWAFITVDKLTKMQYYKYSDTDYNFKWKIWIPIPCYDELFRKIKDNKSLLL